MASGVQFRGKEAVIKAFTARKAEVWSLWHGKDYSTKGEGIDQLVTFLDMLDESSRVQYRLKVYDDLDVKQVKEKTEADGTFTFCLQDDFDEFEDTRYRRGNNRLFQEMDSLKKTIAGLQQPEEEETFKTVALDLLRNPSDALQLVNVWNAITGRPIVAIPAIAGNTMGSVSEDELIERGAAAIEKLKGKDPNLVPHLEKLAAMPDKELQGLLSLLDIKK